jgi:molybdate transport system substrate-binding protein
VTTSAAAAACRCLAAVALCAAAAPLTACDGRPGPGEELIVAAASDLALALPVLAAAFEEETGTRLAVTLGSSGQIAQQILQGAPVDVFLSADRTWVDRLGEGGRLVADGRVIYARGRLALVTAPQHARAFESLDELAAPGVRRVAIANPDHAPYGRAAREALQAADVWPRLADRIVIAENVRQTLQFVASGNVDAAVSALPLMGTDDGHWVALPEELHAPLVQEAAAIAGGRSGEAALRFLQFLAGPRGREILRQHRFILPDAPA